MNDQPQPVGKVLTEDDIRRRFPNVAAGPNEEDAKREAAAAEYRAQQEQNDRIDHIATFREQVGARHAKCSLSNYVVTNPKQQEVILALRHYVNHAHDMIAAGRGVVLFGPSGTGKDHLLVGVGRALLWRYNIPVAWSHGLAMHSAFRDAIASDTLERVLITQYTKPRVWILSDPLPPRGALSEYQAAVLLRIIDQRYRECRPTLVSVNVRNTKEADERLGPAIVDRLRDGAVTAFCGWASYRVGHPVDTQGPTGSVQKKD